MTGFNGTSSPVVGQGQYDLGLALDAEGKTLDAIEAYRMAIQVNPRLAQAHFNLGVDLALVGQHDQAVRAWRRAVWLDSGFRNDLILALDLNDELREAVIVL